MAFASFIRTCGEKLSPTYRRQRIGTVSAAKAARGLVGTMAASPPVGNLHPAPKLNLLQLSSFGISTVVRLSYHGFFRFASVFVTVPSNLVVTIC